MNRKNHIIRYCWTLSLIFLGIAESVNAQGHYAGSSFNTNDYFIPATPGWVFSLYYANSNMDYYNNSGDKSDKIIITPDPPLAIDIGQSVTTSSVIPMALYFGKGKVLNANWGVLLLPMFNNPNANIALDFYNGQNLAGSQNVNINAFGLGDLYLQPLWLTWEQKRSAVTFSYGAWIPVGKYEVNDPENVGLGYWSHNLRLAARHRVLNKISFSGATTWEINSKQKGVDYTEGAHFTLDYGAAYSFPMGHELGLFGHGSWQLGDDKGVKGGVFPDRIFGVGAYGSYWFIPGKLGVLGRVVNNYAARNRYAGFSFQVGINYMVFSQ